MITLTPAEVHLRDLLTARAAGADPAAPEEWTMTYGELATAADPNGEYGWNQGHPRYSRLITALFHVNSYEVEHGRPMVGAFAVSVDSRTSGSGFANLGLDLGREVGEGKAAERDFWKAELERSVAYWSADSRAASGGLSDAQFDAIMAELSKIKQMLRQLRHG